MNNMGKQTQIVFPDQNSCKLLFKASSISAKEEHVKMSKYYLKNNIIFNYIN